MPMTEDLGNRLQILVVLHLILWSLSVSAGEGCDASIPIPSYMIPQSMRSSSKTLGELVSRLQDLEKKWGYEIELVSKFGPKAVPLLVPLLKHENQVVRYRALKSLFDLGAEAKESLPHLTLLFRDTNQTARRLALRITSNQGSAANGLLKDIEALLRDPKATEYDKEAAFAALASIGEVDEQFIPELLRILHGEFYSDTKRSAILCLWRMKAKSPEVLSGLTEVTKIEMESKEPLVILAHAALTHLADNSNEHLSYLFSIVTRDEEQNRCQAIELLGQMKEFGNKGVVPVLAACLKSEDGDERCSALKALVNFNETETLLPNVIALISENADDEEIHLGCAFLASHGANSKAVTPRLIPHLKSNDPRLRRSVLRCLAAIGPEAREAISAIKAILESADEMYYVKEEAELALKRIEVRP